MKITFINPPALNEILSCNPEIIGEQRGFNPPLGLLYLAGYLEKYSTHKLEIIDAQVEQYTYEQLENALTASTPDVVCLTLLTFTVLDVLKTIAIVKEINPKTVVIVGGTHAQIYPEQTIAYPNIDFVILGEGEPVLLKLIEELDSGNKNLNFPGLVYKVGEKIINTGVPPYLDDLDALPFPARHLTPYQKYYSVISEVTPVTTMFTSRGCPFQCNFCDRPNMGKQFRYRSAQNVVDEMELCEKMGIREILIYDDTFTVHKQRAIDICAEYLKRGLTVRWDIRARVDTVTAEMLDKFKQANCTRIHYGVEAGTDRVLKVLNKGITLDQVRKAFQLTKQKKISTLAYFMLGNPTESYEDVLESINFACKLPSDYTQFTIFTPFPATKFYADGLTTGVINEDYWLNFAKAPSASFRSPHWPEILTFGQIIELTNIAYHKFYLRPTYIIKKIFQIRSMPELYRKCKAGFKLIFSKAQRT